MISLYNLPLELLNRIINLSVEDSLILENESERRKILLSLALISKRFTLISQINL